MKPSRGLHGRKSSLSWGELNAALNALVRDGVILSYSAAAGTGASPSIEVAICEGEDDKEVVRRVMEMLPSSFSAAQVRAKTVFGPRFQRVEQAPPEAVCVELWSDGESIRGSVNCPGAVSGSLVPVVPREEGMSAEEALATACHLANMDGRKIVIMDQQDLWRSEWGRLY
jgi:hypothetical protein